MYVVTYTYACMFQQVWVSKCHASKHICGQHRLHARQGLMNISVAGDLAHLAFFSGIALFTVLPCRLPSICVCFFLTPLKHRLK